MSIQKQDVILSGILKHNCGGYGFKITFKDKKHTIMWKNHIHHLLTIQNYQVKSCKAYHDTEVKG